MCTANVNLRRTRISVVNWPFVPMFRSVVRRTCGTTYLTNYVRCWPDVTQSSVFIGPPVVVDLVCPAGWPPADILTSILFPLAIYDVHSSTCVLDKWQYRHLTYAWWRNNQSFSKFTLYIITYTTLITWWMYTLQPSWRQSRRVLTE